MGIRGMWAPTLPPVAAELEPPSSRDGTPTLPPVAAPRGGSAGGPAKPVPRQALEVRDRATITVKTASAPSSRPAGASWLAGARRRSWGRAAPSAGAPGAPAGPRSGPARRPQQLTGAQRPVKRTSQGPAAEPASPGRQRSPLGGWRPEGAWGPTFLQAVRPPLPTRRRDRPADTSPQTRPPHLRQHHSFRPAAPPRSAPSSRPTPRPPPPPGPCCSSGTGPGGR